MPLLRVGGKARQPIVVQLTVEGKEISMEIDTGAAVSLISLVTKEQLFPQNELLDTTLVLTTYTGEQMAVVGRMKVKVNYGETSKLLYLYVVEGGVTKTRNRKSGNGKLEMRKLEIGNHSTFVCARQGDYHIANLMITEVYS